MIGVLADDLTGAGELAGLGLRYGLRAEVLTDPALGSDAELLCVDTDSRSCHPMEAGQRAAAAADRLAALGAGRIYKKVDSVLRGRILAELEAVMKQLGRRRALLVPANPALRRVVRGGKYFVRDQPIHETDFRLDPEYPRRSSSVRELLGATDASAVHLRAGHEPLPETGIIVGEAETADDLRHWAGRCDGATLTAGAAQFFGAWLEASGRRAVSAAGEEDAAATPELFICGSASEACRSFAAQARQRGVPVFGLPASVAAGAELSAEELASLAARAAAALAAAPRVILEIGLPQVTDPRIAPQLAGQLVKLARLVLAGADVGHVFAEGGATGASLLRSMNWSRLVAVREIAQGVVTFRVPGDRQCLLTIKPGSYPWPKQIQ